jgi:hypothetical protein
MNEAYDTTARILAARSARRASIEQQQTQKQQNNEQQLEKEIAALKCFVSEPGALDKVIIGGRREHSERKKSLKNIII